MIAEPEDNSVNPHPIPFRAVRWMVRAAVGVVVVGFAWTIHTSTVKRNDALAVAEKAAAVLRQEAPEIQQLRNELAELHREEFKLWTDARDLARQAAANRDDTAPDPLLFIEDALIANLKGQLIQAEIRREALHEQIAELTKELQPIVPRDDPENGESR